MNLDQKLVQFGKVYGIYNYNYSKIFYTINNKMFGEAGIITKQSYYLLFNCDKYKGNQNFTRAQLSEVLNNTDLSTITNIFKFNYRGDTKYCFMLYKKNHKIDIEDIIQNYNNYPYVYGLNPLDDFDLYIMRRLNI